MWLSTAHELHCCLYCWRLIIFEFHSRADIAAYDPHNPDQGTLYNEVNGTNVS